LSALPIHAHTHTTQNAHQEKLKAVWYTRIFSDDTVLMYKWAVLLITLLINLIMLIDFDTNPNLQQYDVRVSTWYTVLLYILGAIHLALSLSMAACMSDLYVCMSVCMYYV
jgi:hypothetical protein